MKRFSILLVLVILAGCLYAEDDNVITKTMILPGSTCDGVLLTGGIVHLEGILDATPVFIILKGEMTGADNAKYNVDNDFVIGYAEGDFNARVVRINCSNLSYTDKNGKIHSSIIKGYISYNGMAGIPADSIISNTNNLKNIGLDTGIIKKVLDSGVVKDKQIYSKLTELYLKEMGEYLPEFYINPGKTIQLTTLEPIDYLK